MRKLVVSTAAGAATQRAAHLIANVPGVVDVVADPMRGQVVVRYDSSVTTSGGIRRRILPRPHLRGCKGWWLTWWPRLTRGLAVVSRMVRH